MSEFDKERYYAFAVLWERAWKSIDERRGYEWKFAFGIWTALGLVILGLLRHDIPPVGYPALLFSYTFIVLIAVILLHLYWLCNLLKINRINIRFADHYEEEMLKMVDINFIERRRRLIRHWPAYWSIICQIAITILLSVTLFFILIWTYLP